MHDLRGLDVEAANAFVALGRFRRDLARDPDAYGDVDLFAGRRVVANKSTRDEILATRDGVDRLPLADAPLRDGLERWIAYFVAARLTLPDDVAMARAAGERTGLLRLDPPRRVSFSEARRTLVPAAVVSRAEGDAWLAALAGASAELGPLARDRSARRDEIFARMGLEASPAALAPARAAALDVVAREVLDETSDVARAALSDARRKADLANDTPSPIDAVRAALARGAGEGWPARLGPRWLNDLFGKHTRGLALDPRLPQAVLGAASFARALHEMGFAIRVSAVNARLAARSRRGSTFVELADPEPVDAYRVAGAFASLAASPVFHKRALGVSARVAAAQSRALAFTLLFDLRRRAVAWLLARDASPSSFEERTLALFGAPLPLDLAGAWPTPEDDVASRLLGAIEAPDLVRELTSRHDEDFWENPRAWAELRARAVVPLREPPLEIDGVASRVAALFEVALG